MITMLFAAQCANVILPEPTAEALRYYNSGNILWILQQVWGWIIPFLFLITGFSGKLGHFAEKWGKKWFFAIALYLILFIPIFYFLNWPLDFYESYLRQHEYGLSTQTLGRWWDHYLKGIAVTIISAISFVWIFYLLLKKSPKRWWFYSGIAASILSFFLVFVQPIWVAPLFNHFGPMKDKQLEQQILSLANKAGISGARVFEVDKSQDTKAMNAYVTGFGKTGRIVLWDTTIQGLSQDQILFVMGHEMGHYVLHHIWWQLLYFAALSFLIFYITYRICNYLMARYHHHFQFSHLSSIASLPLLLLVTGVLSFLSIPLTNYISRCMEHEADRFGLEITQNNQAAGESFLVLQRENLGNPRPGIIYRIWRGSHPSLQQRVDFFNHYCPWQDGEPLKYEKYFKKDAADMID